MITLIPELPNTTTDLNKELSIIDRYQAIFHGVSETIHELKNINNLHLAMNFGIYEGVHGSLITDYVNVIHDTLAESTPPLVLMTSNADGSTDKEPATTDFENCNDLSRIEMHNEVIQWILEYHGANVNLHTHLNPTPNPYATFKEGKVLFSGPLSDGCSYEVENPKYIDIFRIVNGMINQSEETEYVYLKEIRLIKNKGDVPEYAFELSNTPYTEQAA